MVSDNIWPLVTLENRIWESKASAMMSRTQKKLHTGNYSAAVVAPISKIKSIPLSNESLALIEDATAAIVRFDTKFGTDLVPFASLLLRSESATSSQIENLTASSKAIALAELGDIRKRNATIIASNTRSMKAAIDLANNLNSDGIIQIHRVLLENSSPSIVGQFRQEQVWIGGTSFGPHQADFVPPHHEHISELIEDLTEFMNRDDLPILPQIAVAHAQFETIHPFPDGNGRTGRAIIHALLKSKGIAQNVTVPISAGLLTNVRGYFNSLTAFREGDPEVLIKLIAEKAFVALETGQYLIDELRVIKESWAEQVEARSDSNAWKILELLFKQPVIDTNYIKSELGVTTANAIRAIERLVEANVLKEISGSTRNRKWSADEILESLDNFSAMIGKRSK